MTLGIAGSETTHVDAPETVHAPLLLHFREVVSECGGDAGSLLREAGIRAEIDGSEPISYRQIAALLERTALAVERPDFGLLLAQRQCRDNMTGALGLVMRHARNFGEVLELAVQHGYAHSLASKSWLHRSRSDHAVLFGHDILLEGLTAISQVMEQILLVGHLIAIHLTGGAVRARRILVRHRRLSPPQVYRSYFGCEVRFDQRVNATLYWDEDLARPILSADQPTFRANLANVERQFRQKGLPLSRAVRSLIMHGLDDEECTCEWVADRVSLHPRTLHRHLRREGTSFRRIKDDLRRELAEYYLRCTDLDMKTISDRLGFSEQSALSRRSHRWFDGAPSGLRSAKG